MFKLNPTIALLIMLGIGIQTAFVKSVTLNLIVAILAIVYLAFANVKWRYIGVMMLVSLPLSLATGLSFYFFSTHDMVHLALIYATRLYAYMFLGGAVTLTVTVKELLFSMQQHLRLSSTFTYGILAAFNLLPRVRRQVKTIRYAASLRGITYQLWSPQLYFKAVLSALQWSEDLALAMTSHGFTEGFKRSTTYQDKLPIWQWGLAGLLILAYGVTAFVIQPY